MMKATWFAPKLAARLGAGLVLAWVGQAAVFDLGYQFVHAFGITEVRGTLASAQTGVFSAEEPIEAFLNQSGYSITAFDGGEAVYTVNNANSWWDLEFEPVNPSEPPSAIVVSSPTGLTVDFATPGERTAVTLVLRSDPFGFMFGMQQHNNLADSTFLWADDDAIRLGDTELTYDSSVTFAAIPEPCGWLTVVGYSLVWCLSRRVLPSIWSPGIVPLAGRCLGPGRKANRAVGGGVP